MTELIEDGLEIKIIAVGGGSLETAETAKATVEGKTSQVLDFIETAITIFAGDDPEVFEVTERG